MTLIVGIEADGAVYMGADSGFWSNSAVDTSVESKLHANGPLLIGCAGILRVSNLLRWTMGPLPDRSADVEPQRYVVAEFVPRVRRMLLDHGVMEKDGDGCEKWDGNMLVACGGELFEVSSYLCVFRGARGYATGGHDLAKAVASGVFATTRYLEPRDRLALALKTAAEYTDVVRAPFTFAEQRPEVPSLLAAVA